MQHCQCLTWMSFHRRNSHSMCFHKPMLDLNIFPQMLHSSSLTVRRSPRSLGMMRENGTRANYKYGPLLEALSWRSFLLTLWIFYTIISFSFPLSGKIAKIDESCQKSHYWTSLLSPSSSPPETNEGSVSVRLIRPENLCWCSDQGRLWKKLAFSLLQLSRIFSHSAATF